jgi:dolichol kinase
VVEPQNAGIKGGAASRLPRASLTRKLIHLAMAGLPAVGWWISYGLALALAAAMLGASMIVEVARRSWPWVNQLLWRMLPTVFRESEDHRVLGSTWFAAGALVSLLVFGRDIGGTAVLFLAWGDPMAEIVGGRWGQVGQGKTLVGSLGCFMACIVAGFVGVGLGGLSPWAVLVGAIVATLVERRSPPPDDNLWMPVLSGLGIAVTQWLIGGEIAPH